MPEIPRAIPTAGDDGADGALDRVQWRTASLAVTVIAITILPLFLTGAQSTRIGVDTGIDLTGIGGFIGVFFGTSALVSAATGRAVQRLGWPSGIRVAAAGTGFALAAMSRFPDSWWGAWWPVAGLFVLAGAAAAASQGASNLALVESVPPGRYGIMFGLKHTAVPVAAMFGGLAVPTVALTIGWRWAYLIGAGLALATMAAVPVRASRRPPPERGAAPVARPTTPMPALVALAAAAALGHTAVDALGAFVVPYAVESGLQEGAAGILLTIGSVTGLATRLIGGWLVDSRQHAGLPWMAALFMTGAVGMAVLAAGGHPLLVAGTLVAFAGGWGWAGLLMFVVVRANPAAAAVATGVVNTGKYLGAAVGPVLFGFLAEQVSFTVAWATAATVLFAGGVAVMAIRLTPAGEGMAHPPSTGTAPAGGVLPPHV